MFSLVERPEPVNLDSPPDTLSEGETRSIERQHVHLPKLADCGFIERSPNGDAVERGARFEEIRPLLELLTDYRERFPATQV
ncbi:hypothetical protein [Natronococcus wangiae]|uniref:hypothetical protein n=1 Tax=Natronococcus wangiae TaxID=3068275 RepID=UPI00273D30DD|nr:hypothetical protein [Natronococcus sp. AD5]